MPYTFITNDGKSFSGPLAELKAALDPKITHSFSTNKGMVMVSAYGPNLRYHLPSAEISLSYPTASKGKEYLIALNSLLQMVGHATFMGQDGHNCDRQPIYVPYTLCFWVDRTNPKDKDGAPSINFTQHTITTEFKWWAHCEQSTNLVWVDEEERLRLENLLAQPLNETPSGIKSMVCTGCEGPADFRVDLDEGVVYVSKKGRTRSDWCIGTLGKLAKAIKDNTEEADYLFACDNCDDECGAIVTFKDGTVTADAEPAFRKAFPEVFGLPAAPASAPASTPASASKASVTSADCVAYAISQLSDLPSNPKLWKRRSKKNVGDTIERRFEVVGTTRNVVVVERDGVIVEARIEN